MLSSNIRIPGDEKGVNFSDGLGGLFMLARRGFVSIWNMTDTPRIKMKFGFKT